MSLAPIASVDLGSFRYATHAANVTVSLGLLPAVSSFRVRLPAGTPVDAKPGDPAVLRMDGGEGEETVLTGTVHAVRRLLDGTVVTGGDASAALAALRSGSTFERMSAADVIQSLSAEAGVDVQASVDLRLAAYVAGQQRTAAEHVAYLAGLGGAIAFTTGDGALSVIPRPDEAEVALLYGREIREYRETDREPGPMRAAIGAGPAGTPDAPDALKHTLTGLPGDAPEAGPDAVRQGVGLLRTPSAATSATEALTKAAAAESVRFRASCFLLPALRPGTVIQVQELPSPLTGGPWLIERVVHRLDRNSGGRTVLEGTTASPPSEGLLGALAGAIGGLL
jgi:prophage tail gpP-like protein